MENKAHALAAGLFLLLLGAAMAAAIVWFRGDHVDRLGYTVVARTGVSGLSVKAAVKLRGVEVGSVESSAFVPADPRRILVRIVVARAAPRTRGTRALLGYLGVTGLSFIELADRGDDPRLLAGLPAHERQLELEPSLLDRLATGGPALLAAFAETAERMNTLLAPQNQQRVQRLLDRSEEVLDQLSQRTQELRPAIAALPPAIQRFGAASARADGTLQRLDVVAEQAAGLVADVRGRLPVLDRAGDAARRLEAAARAIELGFVGPEPLPSPPLVETLSRAANGIDRAAGQWAEQPQSLIFGRTPAPPGPGEAGFVAASQGAK